MEGTFFQCSGLASDKHVENKFWCGLLPNLGVLYIEYSTVDWFSHIVLPIKDNVISKEIIIIIKIYFQMIMSDCSKS